VHPDWSAGKPDVIVWAKYRNPAQSTQQIYSVVPDRWVASGTLG
jgi:hypothetical protein